MLGIRSVHAFVLILAAASVSPSTAFAEEKGRQNLPAPVAKVLFWLPEDTETLVFAKDLTVSPQHPKLSFSDVLGGLAYDIPKQLQSQLDGEELEWAIRGGKNYDTVSSFGGLRYEGAGVLKLDGGRSFDAIKKRLQQNAAKVESISGYEVFVFPIDRDEMEPWVDPKPWQGEFVVLLPKHSIVLTATSDAYLTELLSRKPFDKDPAENAARALPASLPEWQHVDTSADAWMVRHVPDEAAESLRGIVWWGRKDGRPVFRTVYLPMPGRKVKQLATPWKSDESFLRVETSEDGVVTATLRPSATDKDRGRFMAYTLFYPHWTLGLR